MATRYRIGCTLGLMLSGLTLQALAEPPATPASNDTGLMTFPNVRLENAPDASRQKPASNSAAAAGVRAFMEGDQIKEATAADAAQLSAAAPAQTLSVSNSSTSSAAIAADTGPTMLNGPFNSTEIVPNTEETMMFEMAHKDANGKLTQECVTGEDSAKHALHSPARAKQQESRNDR